LALATTCLSVVVLSGAAWPGGAAASSVGRGFVATAEASGMYVRYGIPGFLVVENFIDGGGPVSQAVLGSDGTSQSFASLPYPGPTAIGYPGLAALVTGSAPPGYPFYASASNPVQPKQAVSDPFGAYSLSAEAGDTRSTSDARFSPTGKPEESAPSTQSLSNVTVDGDKVVSTAVSLGHGIVAGPLTIGTVRSSSTTTYQKGADSPVTQTELRVQGGKVNDMTFSFGPEGLQVAQQGVPVPAGTGLQSLNQALAPSGLSIHFAEATTREGGAAAGALEIVDTAPVPGAGQGTLRIRFGGASSMISLGAVEGAATADTGSASDSGSDGGGYTYPGQSSSEQAAAAQSPSAVTPPAAPDSALTPTTDGLFAPPAPSGAEFTAGSGSSDAVAAPSEVPGPVAEPSVASVALGSAPRSLPSASAASAVAELYSLRSPSYLAGLLGVAVLLIGGMVVWLGALRRKSWTA
jgi:hypothetical protein